MGPRVPFAPALLTLSLYITLYKYFFFFRLFIFLYVPCVMVNKAVKIYILTANLMMALHEMCSRVHHRTTSQEPVLKTVCIEESLLKKVYGITNNGMTKDEGGSWEAPLPFRHEIRELPSRRDYAMKHLKFTCRTLDKEHLMKVHYLINFLSWSRRGHPSQKLEV